MRKEWRFDGMWLHTSWKMCRGTGFGEEDRSEM